MRSALQRPGQPDLRGRRAVGARDGEYLAGLGTGGARPAAPAGDCEERHEGDALLPAGVTNSCSAPAGADAVPVLHADDRRDGLGLGELLRCHAGDAQVTDQSGVAQLGQCAEMLGE